MPAESIFIGFQPETRQKWRSSPDRKSVITTLWAKTLVIYYSLSGHTKDIADRIALLTDADVYEIKPKEPLKPGILFSLDARRQLKSGNYPKIEENLPDASAYDMIFVGAPIWWYTAATPVLEFLKTYDFKGRKVVPFSTQGSNFGSYFDDFAAKAKKCKDFAGRVIQQSVEKI